MGNREAKSSMYEVNSNGPRILPWETADVTGDQLLETPERISR